MPMLTRDQIESLEEQLAQEHRKDLEALARLKRFLPQNGHQEPAPKQEPFALRPQMREFAPMTRGLDLLIPAKTDSLIGQIEQAMAADHSLEWTVPKMMGYLRRINFEFQGATPEKTIGLSFVRLLKRGKVELVRRGAGRIPNVYKWRTNK